MTAAASPFPIDLPEDPREAYETMQLIGQDLIERVWPVVSRFSVPRERFEMGVEMLKESPLYVAHTGSWEEGGGAVLMEHGLVLTYVVGRLHEWRVAV